MSLVIDIADAVTAELNAAPPDTFDPTFTAQRRVLPVFELEDLAELRVTVVPKVVEITGATRSTSQYEISVDIGVQRKLTTGGQDLDAEVTTLCDLVDQITEFMRQRPLTAMPGVVWVGVANDPVYAPEHLAEQRVFTSVLTVTYRALK